MIVEINDYELESEDIVNFYPCDILGNYKEQSDALTHIEFKNGFKGIYFCNASELSEKMGKDSAKITDGKVVYWLKEVKKELKTRKFPEYKDDVFEALDKAIAKFNEPEITYAWQDSIPDVDNDYGNYAYTCPKCHKAQRNKSKFCPECGVKMNNA